MQVRLIGVLTALALMLAIPALAGESGCKWETQKCLDYMAEDLRSRGWVGVNLEQNETTGGYTIVEVVPDSPAAGVGLEIGDVLVSVNGNSLPIQDEEQMKQMKQIFKPGATVDYVVSRNGEKKAIAIELGTFPEHVIAEAIGRHLLDAHVAIAKK